MTSNNTRNQVGMLVALLVAMIVLSSCGRDALRQDRDLVEEETTSSEVETTTTTTTTSVPEVEILAAPAVRDRSTEETLEVEEEVVEEFILAPIPAPTTTPLAREEVWVDRPESAFMRIDSIGTYAPTEITTVSGVEYFPEGPSAGIVQHPATSEVDPCELGTVWVITHSHSIGATPWMVVQEGDDADANARARNHPGIQLEDKIVFELIDGTTCTYEVRPFPETATGEPARSVGETPVMTWSKDRFLAREQAHPWQEWYTPDDESVLYISTSGGWPMVTKANGRQGRPSADTVYAVLVESDHPPVYAD